jgi:hypothetical protein
MFDLASTSNTATSTLLLPLIFDVAVLLVLTKSNVSGNSKVAVAVFLVLTKSNISGNSNVDVAVLPVLTKSNISGNGNATYV